MFRTALLVAVACATLSTTAVAAGVQASASVDLGGFYGRIDIGGLPPPVVVYPQPVVIQPAPVAVVRQPIYLRVPPGHAKHWDKHCRKYGACGQPVYFVQEDWYRQAYLPARARPVMLERQPQAWVEYSADRDPGDERHERGHGRGKGRGRDR